MVEKRQRGDLEDSTSVVMVPMHLDALCLEKDAMVSDAMVDFSRLPFFDGTRDINPDVAPVSEEILSQPLQNKNLLLGSGIHLHWALPDALTLGERGRPAKAAARLSNGVVSAVEITDGGTGYIADPAVAITDANGRHATAEATVDTGRVTQVTVTNGGSALREPVTVTLSPPQDLVWPAAPNRWLVTRRLNGEPEKRWVVESDYLYPDGDPGGQGRNAGAITYPAEGASGTSPFRYLGRHLTFDEWRKGEDEAEHLERLTAVGYGETTFSGFYPNCRSVFGFHDEDQTPREGLHYEVVGWYSDPAVDRLFELLEKRSDASPNDLVQEYLKWLVPAHRQAFLDEFGETEGDAIWKKLRTEDIAWLEAIGKGELDEKEADADADADAVAVDEEFAKIVPRDQRPAIALDESLAPHETAIERILEAIPQRMICFARIDFSAAAEAGDIEHPAIDAKGARVAVGNTGTEALSAHLADLVGNGDDSHVEARLEALHLKTNLEPRKLDLGAKFEEARHEKGFIGVPGGVRWSLRVETEIAAPADAEEGHAWKQLDLPEDIAHALNDLNLIQDECNRLRFEIKSLEKDLFSDWHKYLVCAYPPEGSRDEFPDIDEARFHLEVRSIGGLEKKRKEEQTLVARCEESLKELLETLDLHNTRLSILNDLSVLDWPVFLKKLQTEPVHSQLPEALRSALSGVKADPFPPKEDMVRIISALNALLLDPATETLLGKLGDLPEAPLQSLESLPSTGMPVRTARRNRILLEALFPSVIAKSSKANFVVKTSPSPRFWLPREPVVLIAGEALEASERHGRDGRFRKGDGLLRCECLALPGEGMSTEAVLDAATSAHRTNQTHRGRRYSRFRHMVAPALASSSSRVESRSASP